MKIVFFWLYKHLIGILKSSFLNSIYPNNVIADFICPTPEARKIFPADYIIWVDTIKEGRFEDTNQMFVKPEKFDFHVTTQDANLWAPKIVEDLK